MNSFKLKNELLCLGCRIYQNIDGYRVTGAGPAGGKDFLLPNGVCVNIPLEGYFVKKSPFTLINEDDRWKILKDGEFVVEATPVPIPKFYSKRTSDGVPMSKIAILHGKDCLASTVYSKCVYWRSGQQCKFCGIEAWQYKPSPPIERKTPEQLGEVVEEAFKEKVVEHVTLTVGTPPSPDKGAKMLAEVTEGIKCRVNIPVHVQLEPPEDTSFLEMLYYAGVDTIGIHIESFDRKVLTEVCPMKSKPEMFFKAWKYAVNIFGDCQVDSFILVGLGESDASILRGVEELAGLGVFPYILPLRPVLGSSLEGAYPPSPERMLRIYQHVSDILHAYGLDPSKNKAGCVRCSACSAIREAFLNI